MLALPGPKLVNQSAKVHPVIKLAPKGSVDMGKVSIRKTLNTGLTRFYVTVSPVNVIFL